MKEEEEFPLDVYEQLKTIPSEVLENEYQGRRDLREQMIFTIDGDAIIGIIAMIAYFVGQLLVLFLSRLRGSFLRRAVQLKVLLQDLSTSLRLMVLTSRRSMMLKVI